MAQYSAAVREVLPGPPDHSLVRLWPPSPHPRVYVLVAFARVLDGIVARRYGLSSCAAVYRPHPEALTNAIDIVIPSTVGNVRDIAAECMREAASECRTQMLSYHEALTKALAGDDS